MSLRIKTIIIIFLTFAGLLVILLGAASVIVRGGFERVEESDVRQAAEVLVSTLNREIDSLSLVNVDYASWDDTYQFIEDGNRTYKDVNLLDATFTNLHINFILFVHASGRIVYGTGFDLESLKQTPLPRHFIENIDHYGLLFKENETKRQVKGIVLFPEGPALISSCPIIKSSYGGPVRGALIMGRYLNAGKVKQLSETVHLPVSIFPFRDGKMPPEIEAIYAGSASGERIAVKPVNATTIAGYSIINDIYGKQALTVRLEKPRSIYLQGLATLRYYIIFLCLAGVLFGAILLVLLEKSILSRIARIQHRVKDISTTQHFSERISESGRDELANLSTGINTMLESIESARRLLVESEERYRHLADSSFEGLFIHEKGEILDLNQSMGQMFGYGHDEVIGKSIMDFIAPESIEIVLRNMQLGYDRSFEVILKRRDGNTFTAEIMGKPIVYMGRQARVVALRDITERKQAEEALKRSEERYRSILQNIEEGYYEVDLAGNITFFNESMREMLGYSSDELMGINNRRLMTKETAATVFKTFNMVYSTGNPSQAFDWELLRKDGGKIYVSTSVSLVNDPGNNAIGFRGITRDVTEQKRSEEKLKESEKKYRNLVENIKDIFYVADEAGIITYISPVVETASGFRPDELIGKRITDFLHPDDVPLLAQEFHKILKGIMTPLEYRVINKSGTIMWVRTLTQPVYDESTGKRVIGVQGVISDITDRKIAEEDVKAHREHLELINKILRHDVTNDLATIRSALSLYKDSREEELLVETSRRVEKSVALIRRMRELESFMSSRRNLKLFNIQEIVNRIIGNYPALELSMQGEFHPVLADEAVESVIDNILRNAFVHGKARKIAISAETSGDFLVMRIADDGIGIPGKIKERIFEEGFIYGATGQTGLGLHIVKKAMESYGGSVHAVDNTPRGAVFVLGFRMV